jgi:platelet-activating factor acetylhydrolase IB subunit beta/gamma
MTHLGPLGRTAGMRAATKITRARNWEVSMRLAKIAHIFGLGLTLAALPGASPASAAPLWPGGDDPMFQDRKHTQSVNASANPCSGLMDVQTTEPKPRPEFRPERQEEIKRRLLSDSFGTITLGDSIMEGWGPRMLESAFNQPTLNSGFGMDGAEQVLWRIRSMDWSHQNPQFVLLLVGTNDLNFPACSVVQGVLAVVRAVHGVLPGAKVIVTSILPRGESMLEHDAEIVQINEDLAAAQSEQRFHFFNIHDAFLCNHKTPCALFQPGNLHLTPAGYQLITDSLHQFLQRN